MPVAHPFYYLRPWSGGLIRGVIPNRSRFVLNRVQLPREETSVYIDPLCIKYLIWAPSNNQRERKEGNLWGWRIL